MPTVSLTQKMKYIFLSLRPKQWIKNLFVLAALFFVREFFLPEQVARALFAVVLFCLVSSSVYVFNDIIDLGADKLHPVKRLRPLAAGLVSKSLMMFIAFVLAISAFVGGFGLNANFGLAVVGYFILQLIYSLVLKRIVILDVITIATGFVMRVVAGALAISVSFSPWLIFCTFFLTLFMAISKRKSELALSNNAEARAVLANYSVAFLDQMNTMVLPLTVVTYTFYTFSSEHSKYLMLTVPVVLYGLFRYLLVASKETVHNDGPTDLILGDRGLQLTVVIWILVVLTVLTFQR